MFQSRKEILKIHTRQWNPPPSEDFLSELAEKCVGKTDSRWMNFSLLQCVLLCLPPLSRLLRRRHQGGVHGGGALRSAPPLPADLQHLPEAPAGRLLHLRQQLRLCGGHEENVPRLPPLCRLPRQTPVTRGPAPARRRPAPRHGGPAATVSARRAGHEEETGAR